MDEVENIETRPAHAGGRAGLHPVCTGANSELYGGVGGGQGGSGVSHCRACSCRGMNSSGFVRLNYLLETDTAQRRRTFMELFFFLNKCHSYTHCPPLSVSGGVGFLCPEGDQCVHLSLIICYSFARGGGGVLGGVRFVTVTQ